MAKLGSSSSGNKKMNNGIVKLKSAVGKLQRSLSLGKKSNSGQEDHDDQDHHFNNDYEVGDDHDESTRVPDDVKEGHFAVVAVEGDQPKRFVVPLSCLTHPTFLRLLEQAAEEYGFDHEGALTIPCQPSELERILADHWLQREPEDHDDDDDDDDDTNCVWRF